jgi:hypothetical protein
MVMSFSPSFLRSFLKVFRNKNKQKTALSDILKLSTEPTIFLRKEFFFHYFNPFEYFFFLKITSHPRHSFPLGFYEKIFLIFFLPRIFYLSPHPPAREEYVKRGKIAPERRKIFTNTTIRKFSPSCSAYFYPFLFNPFFTTLETSGNLWWWEKLFHCLTLAWELPR